jgi:hypothetical protein
MTLYSIEEFEEDFGDVETSEEFVTELEEDLEVESDPEYASIVDEHRIELEEDDPPIDYKTLNAGKPESWLSAVNSIEVQSKGAPIGWIHPGILMEGMSTILVAREGVGKSLFAVNLANAVANGTEFLGFKPKPRPVLYLDLENPLAVVAKRAKEFGLKTGGNFSYVGLFTHHGDVPNPGLKVKDASVVSHK